VRLLVVVGLLGALALGFSGCSSGSQGTASGPLSRDPLRGGTLRVGVDSPFGTEPASGSGPYALDPQAEYSASPWELYRCCLLRTLLSYNGKPTAAGGESLRPDLATRLPDVSGDGLVWTFHLKRGLHYAPPFQGREIVAGDVVRALEREFRLGTNASYSFYYFVIEGAHAFASHKADSISGLEVSDPHTLVVHLTEPTGDLGYRFSLAATAPIPAGADRGHDDGYGRYLVSSGPYMIAGSEKMNFALPPAKQHPASGWVYRYAVRKTGVVLVGRELLTLVRNPSWVPRSDLLREAYPDRIELEMQGAFNSERMRNARKIDRGSLDVELGESASFDQTRRYERSGLRNRLHANAGSGVEFTPINLAVPPFDDVHVRRALNLVLDRTALVRIENGAGSLRPLTLTEHFLPDSVEADLLATGHPFNSRGDVVAARAMMARSRYDRNHDGRCDIPACRNVVAYGVALDSWPLRGADALMRRDFARIGVILAIRHASLRMMVQTLLLPRRRVALLLDQGWLVDFPDGASFAPVLQHPTDTINRDISLLGATPRQLRRWGYRVRSVPNVDDKIAQCGALLGGSRARCWAELDQLLAERIVPWVTHAQAAYVTVTSARVARYSFDQFATSPALDRIALKPDSR
jgi:hypothetical protein